MKERYNPKVADDAQYIFCRERGLMRFAPYRGYCKNCKNNIYEHIDRNGNKTGISVWEAASRHIILCPHCGFDFYKAKTENLRIERMKFKEMFKRSKKDE